VSAAATASVLPPSRPSSLPNPSSHTPTPAIQADPRGDYERTRQLEQPGTLVFTPQGIEYRSLLEGPPGGRAAQEGDDIELSYSVYRLASGAYFKCECAGGTGRVLVALGRPSALHPASRPPLLPSPDLLQPADSSGGTPVLLFGEGYGYEGRDDVGQTIRVSLGRPGDMPLAGFLGLLGARPGARRRILVPPGALGWDADGRTGPIPDSFGSRRRLINHLSEPLLLEVEVARVDAGSSSSLGREARGGLALEDMRFTTAFRLPTPTPAGVNTAEGAAGLPAEVPGATGVPGLATRGVVKMYD